MTKLEVYFVNEEIIIVSSSSSSLLGSRKFGILLDVIISQEDIFSTKVDINYNQQKKSYDFYDNWLWMGKRRWQQKRRIGKRKWLKWMNERKNSNQYNEGFVFKYIHIIYDSFILSNCQPLLFYFIFKSSLKILSTL